MELIRRGSTSIQKFFKKNQKVLENNGICYPQFPGDPQSHTWLKGSLAKNRLDEVEICYEILEKAVSNPKINTVVLSSEHFWPTKPHLVQSMMNRLRDLFEHINVVVYLRNQVDLWISLLAQQSKGLKVDSKSALWGIKATFIGNDIKTHGRYYHKMISSYSELLGNNSIICRLYDRNLFPGGDVVNDFGAIVSDKFNSLNLHSLRRDANDSFAWKATSACVHIADRMNQTDRKALAIKFRDTVKRMDSQYDEWYGKSPCYLSEYEQLKIIEHYREDNESLIRDGFIKADGIFNNCDTYKAEEREFYDIAKHELDRFKELFFDKINAAGLELASW